MLVSSSDSTITLCGLHLKRSCIGRTHPHASAPVADLTPLCPAGVLLGAGSFGRVYSGTWQGQRVAVKVLTHGPHETAVIERELQVGGRDVMGTWEGHVGGGHDSESWRR